MKTTLSINNKEYFLDIYPSDTLLKTLRQIGFFSVKSGGCKKGECGACTVLLDGKPINSCTMLALQAEGHLITTIENIGEHPDQGWKKTEGFDVLQESFIKSGAIQCGYCTPAMILAAKSLLDRCENPTEKQIQEAISGVLCRCTGYKKPIQSIKASVSVKEHGVNLDEALASQKILPEMERSEKSLELKSVGHPDIKVDAIKLVQGKSTFTDDFILRDMLYAKILHSPVAHARIKEINVEEAKALPGVVAVLTWRDLPRVIYSTAGQSDPIPGPLDMFSLDNVVRFVGDRVAFVAAESEMIAEHALQLIKVEYEELPPVFDSSVAMKSTSFQLHQEKEYVNFADSDPKKNLAAKIRIDIGNIDIGFSKADKIFESDYEVSKVQQVHIEPHVAISYWDEDDRLVIRTSTQVPFHARRILAPVLGLPVKRIRVIKPRIGGGFGGKQEILIEDVVAHLTIATKRPVRLEYSREEEFTASRSRHPMKIHIKTGVKNDGTITANDMYILTDTGAYGCHALTVTGNTGHKAMALYVGDGEYRKSPNIRFYADIVYTNHPPAGAFRGYGVPQGYWAVERHMEKITRALKLDPIEFRLKNALKSGELHPFSTAWSEGREPTPEIIHTVGLADCIKKGKRAIDWDKKFGNVEWHSVKGKPYLRRGIGLATVMQGTAISYLDMGGASIKMNDDGSFNLLIGATDLGTGSDTVLAQMAAEVLGVNSDDILVYSSDTDFTPFDKGAYASSTTYISGAAVIKAAEKVAERIKSRAATMFNLDPDHSKNDENSIHLADRCAIANDGRRITLAQIALNSLHHNNQEQIMAVASYMSPSSPPPFAAQFAEVLVDIETGRLSVEKLVMAVDSGTIVNPLTASGQIEGGMAQALGYAVCEEMTYDEKGNPREKDLVDYHVFRADEMPELETIFIQTFEPSHPFGAKAVAEIPLDGVAPAVGNAVKDACGADVDTLPITPEKIWLALQKTK
jgi:putative selenate reductase molybdopterin-binding subunit